MRLLGAGDLTRKVLIERPPTTTDANGAPYGDWTAVMRLNAKFGKRLGGESLGGGAFEAESTQTITVRYNPAITTAMRLSYAGRHFDILSISDVMGRHEWTELTCREGPSHGN